MPSELEESEQSSGRKRQGGEGPACEHCGRAGPKKVAIRSEMNEGSHNTVTSPEEPTSSRGAKEASNLGIKSKKSKTQPQKAAKVTTETEESEINLFDQGVADDIKDKLKAGLQKRFVRQTAAPGGQEPTVQPMTRQEQRIQEVRDVQSEVRADIDAYPELKVPLEFVSKFEHDKKMNAGAVLYARREVQDEMRIRYLQRSLASLEECRERDMKDVELKLRSKMHVYVKECLEQITHELTDQFKLIFVQLDKVCEKEKIQRRIIFELKNEMK